MWFVYRVLFNYGGSILKIEMIKFAGGNLAPATDEELEKLNKFKNGEQYTVDIKLTRSPQFHRKVFGFLSYCFQFWKGDNEFQDESKQFDVFRNHLTVLAGFYDSYYNINGEVRIEAKSLAYGNMSQEEYEKCYNALINAALKHIFKTADENTMNHLLSFF